MKLPLQLPYLEASTVCDAAGAAIAECRDNETARAVVDALNVAHDLRVVLPANANLLPQVVNRFLFVMDVLREV